jgi:ubiquinone/menaquinone biosynthesis C-methylase UbiE
MASPVSQNKIRNHAPPSVGPANSGVQENVDAHFDTNAAYWDEIYRDDDLQSVIYQERQGAVLDYVDAAGLSAGSSVLEIGCGAGHLTVRLAQRELKVNAIDSSPGMVDLASRQAAEAGFAAEVSVSQADAHALPFKSDEFDLVVAVGVIPWLHSPGAAVAEMARVLRPGGQLVLTADNAARLISFTDPRGLLALTPLRRVYHRLRNRPGDAVSRLHFPRRISGFVSDAGLTPLAHRTIGFGPLSVLGRPLLSDARAVGVNRRLQRLSDAGVPGARGTGWHYVLRAAKR